MTTPQQKAAREAIGRMGNIDALATQIAAAQCAIRAMIATHPEPEKVRAVYDQLVGQLMAIPAIAADSDKMLVLRDLTETLFRPPVVLDTED